MIAEIVGGIRLNQGEHAVHSYTISPDSANLIADIFTQSIYAGMPPQINGNFSLIEGVAKIVRGNVSLNINPTYPNQLYIDIEDTAFIWDGAWALPFAAVINIGGTFAVDEVVKIYGVSGTFPNFTTVELASFSGAGSFSFNFAKLIRFSRAVDVDSFNELIPMVKITSTLTSSQVTASADVLELVLINSKQA